jgi:hypothetical protein
MLPDLSAQVLRSMAGGQKFSGVQLGIGGDGRFTLNIA